MKKYQAIVFGLSGTNSLGIIRSLGTKQIDTIGIQIGEPKYPAAQYSKYLKQAHFIKNEKGLVDLLNNIETYNNIKIPIFSTGDKEVEIISHVENKILKKFFIPKTEKYQLSDLMNKKKVFSLAEESGFNIPEIFTIQEMNNIKNINKFRKISFPLILKPNTSNIGTKKDMKIIYNKESLEQNLKAIKSENYYLQEYISEQVENNYDIHTYLSSQGPIIGNMIQKIQVSKFSNGIPKGGGIIKSVIIPDLIEPSLNLTNKLNYKGILGFDIIKSKNKNYFIEANIRTSANNYLDTISGIDLSTLLTLDINGEHISDLRSKQIQENIYWLAENQVVHELLKGNLSFEELKKYINDKTVFGYYHKEDIAPLSNLLKSGKFLPK